MQSRIQKKTAWYYIDARYEKLFLTARLIWSIQINDFAFFERIHIFCQICIPQTPYHKVRRLEKEMFRNPSHKVP